MNELIKNTEKMSSREIAELTGKLHKHVLVDCDKLNESYRNLGMDEISSVDYKADNGQYYREFQLTKIQTFDLMTGYDAVLRIKVNRRWEELETEKQKQLPSVEQLLQNLQLLFNMEREQSKIKEQLTDLTKRMEILLDITKIPNTKLRLRLVERLGYETPKDVSTETELITKYLSPGDKFMTNTEIKNYLESESGMVLSARKIGLELKTIGFSKVTRRLDAYTIRKGYLVGFKPDSFQI